MSDPSTIFDKTDPTTPGYYGPSQTALLLLDFHSMLVQKAGGPKALVALRVAADMRAWAKSQGIQVVHALIDLNTSTFETCRGAYKLMETVASARSSGGEEVIELSEGSSDDVTFTRKPGHVSALRSPGLDEFLRQRGIKSLVLTGLTTSGCVMRTAVAATDAEYVTTVISDGCADSDEAVHDIMINKVLNNRGYVTTATEFQDGFKKAQEAE
ncbi:Isochorismatase hydrolase [Daldinia decipiens]|uniref:Isochorismatase hydrolase n=1 Tax=Daldinia decipiens TaxID=326647 RepID=UPI0020C309DF|nr:Isochorismatase hydrolase [Daldinia decipiens]KAI1653792.1 Isochorismatase hydrolase [Daldinia decipiens]